MRAASSRIGRLADLQRRAEEVPVEEYVALTQALMAAGVQAGRSVQAGAALAPGAGPGEVAACDAVSAACSYMVAPTPQGAGL